MNSTGSGTRVSRSILPPRVCPGAAHKQTWFLKQKFEHRLAFRKTLFRQDYLKATSGPFFEYR